MAEISTEEGKKLSGRIDRGRNSVIFPKNGVIGGYGNNLEVAVNPLATTEVLVKPGLGIAGKADTNIGANCLIEVTEDETVTVTNDGAFSVVYRVNLSSDEVLLTLTDTLQTDDLVNNLVGTNDLELATIVVSGGVITDILDKRNIFDSSGGGAGGIISAISTGYDDNDYSSGSSPWNVNRNLFDRIMYTEVDRLANRFPETVMQVYYNPDLYPTLKTSLQKVNSTLTYFILTIDTSTGKGSIEMENSTTGKVGIASIDRSAVSKSNIGWHFYLNNQVAEEYGFSKEGEIKVKDYYDFAKTLTEEQVQEFAPKIVSDVSEGDIVNWTNSQAKDTIVESGSLVGIVNELSGCNIPLYELGYRVLTDVELSSMEFNEPIHLDGEEKTRSILTTDGVELYYCLNFSISPSYGADYDISAGINESGGFYPITDFSGSSVDVKLSGYGSIKC